MNNYLKPCPFCDSEADTWIDNHYQDRFVVECQNCGTNVRDEYSMQNAIKSWNSRPYLIPVAIAYQTDVTLRYVDFDENIKDHENYVEKHFNEKLMSYDILYKEKTSC